MRTLGRADALEDPRFNDWRARTDNEAALREVIESALAKDDPKSWEARLTAADVPCATVWKIEEITRHPQLDSRDVLQTIDSRYGPMRLVGAGFRLAHGGPGIEREPPTLGEHTDEILGEAGYEPAEITRLRREPGGCGPCHPPGPTGPGPPLTFPASPIRFSCPGRHP